MRTPTGDLANLAPIIEEALTFYARRRQAQHHRDKPLPDFAGAEEPPELAEKGAAAYFIAKLSNALQD